MTREPLDSRRLAEADDTLKFAVVDALAATGHLHRMTPDQAEQVAAEIYASILKPEIRWTIRTLAMREGPA